MKRAIVLSGGGSKGAYQMGVWRALRKMHLNFDIVTGTSVGALNGALMVQGNYHKGISLWKQLSFQLLFSDDDYSDFAKANSLKEIYKIYAKSIILSGGIAPNRLENTLRGVLDETKIRKSKIDFGMVAVKVPRYEPICLAKKDLPHGKMIDYLMASATCFPAFQLKKIGKETFVDGGYYDNMPINLAIALGATEIIAVDLNAIGIKQLPKNDMKITYIRPNNDLGSFLVFDKTMANKNIKYGYNDTLKVFGWLDGKKYTFKRNHLQINFKKYKENFVKLGKYIYELDEKKHFKGLVNRKLMKVIAGTDKEIFDCINKQMEYLGVVFNIDNSNIYSVKTFNGLLISHLDDIEIIDLDYIEKMIKSKQIKDLLNKEIIIKYIYNNLKDVWFDKKHVKILLMVINFFPKELLGTLYLWTINGHTIKKKLGGI
ncbi:MAG: patatin-like phospholipase family protein [Bacilli bacterium]